MANACLEIFDKCEIYAHSFGQSHDVEGVRIGSIVGPVELKNLWRNDDLQKVGAGLYAYARPDGHPVYFGRSLTAVHARLWRHLKTPQNLKEGQYKEQGFPDNRWAKRKNTDPGIQELFSRGEILSYAFKVEPISIIALLEGYAIWLLKQRPPPYLNIRDS